MAQRTSATLNEADTRAVASVISDAEDQAVIVRGVFSDAGLSLESTKAEYASALSQEALTIVVKESGKLYRNATAALNALHPKVDEDESDEG